VRLTYVSYGYDDPTEAPEALLRRYGMLTGLAQAVAEAGGSDISVTVVLRFSRDVVLRDGPVAYHFVADGPPRARADRQWAARLVSAVVTLHPDIVHLHGCLSLPTRHLRLRLPRATPLLVQDHGGVYPGAPIFTRWKSRAFHAFGLRAADGFLFSARALATPWLRAGIIGPQQGIYELMESSSTMVEAPAPRDGERSLPGRPALLWVARLDANKDPLTVLEGFERASGRLPEAALTMVFGASQLLAEVERKIADSATLRGRVHLLGKLEQGELAALYRAADLFVLGSHHEGSGFALIEALSFGVVPVVSDIPSFRVLTDGGRLGALFPVEDAGALGRALERLGSLESSNERTVRRAAVRAHFERELSWSALAHRALGIYREALARRRGQIARAATRTDRA
jgi:glycosyltransferase involved in cell wall biosynthesis